MDELVVVKFGGSIATRSEAVSRDLAALARSGTPLVVVHGGSVDISGVRARLGLPDRRLVAPDGLSTRHTDPATLEAIMMALCGLTKPRLVQALTAAGAIAVGLTGLDAGLLRARRKHAHRSVVDGRTVVVRDNQSGRISEVNTGLLRLLVEAGMVPVVSPPAMAEDGQPVNVDADRVAAAVAVALQASCLVLLTGAAGVLADPDDPTSTLPNLTIDQQSLPDCATGGMRMKLIAASDALRDGVPRVLIADGRTEQPVRRALAGIGSTTVGIRRQAC
ncbi:MAG: [LysW]-aminoadipate kinase [Jatrophihabitantaceae bacterium]